MKSLYVEDLEKGLLVSKESFLVILSDKAEDKNGNTYYKLTLGDKTGQIEGKVWSEVASKTDEKIIKPGNIIAISAKVEEFKGLLQLNIQSLEAIDETKLDDFLETSKFDADEMFSEVMQTIEEINDKDIKEILKKIFSDKEIKRRYIYWPAASVVHHNFRSGLLQHIVEMLTIAKGLTKFYPDADYDILNAGIILHDIGKIYELDAADLSCPYSKEGLLLGHISMSLRLFEDFGGRTLPEDKYLHIAHLILSHHGTLEYGSPVVPATVEAIMLTYIDDLSAKSRTADTVKNRIPEKENFSQRIMWLENAKIWKGTTPNFSQGLDVPESQASEEEINEQLEF